MPRPRNIVPSYRLHRQSGQAVVTIYEDGRRRDILLGRHGSPESKEEYERILARVRANLPARPFDTTPLPKNITVAEVLVAFLKYANSYYIGHDGKPTSETWEYRLTARGVRELFGELPAVEFGPKKLATVRDRWVAAGLSRREVNRRATKVKRIFRWAAQEEMIPESVAASVATLIGLAKGRTPARETEPIKPVDPVDVEPVLPHVLPSVAAMVQVQLLTGMRPGEVCLLRPVDIDRSGEVWVYRPHAHKGTWRGTDRVISIGPKAQALLLEHWPANPAEYIFCPARSMAVRLAERSEKRVTPRYPSHMKRNTAKRKAVPDRAPSDHYTHLTYRRAIERGVTRVNAIRKKMAVSDPTHGPNLPMVELWSPNQLRHTHATDVRRRFGLEAAQVVLGHSKADITQVYAERNLDLAAVVAKAVG